MKDIHYLQHRHIGVGEVERQEMLRTIGVKSLDELIDQVIPSDIRTEIQPFEAIPEKEGIEHSEEDEFLGKECIPAMAGQGYYGTILPPVIQRNVLDNPNWYTSYTPYQAEISQGRLEVLFLFQTVICELTGMPLASCSLLDEATACAESMTMMSRLNKRSRKIFVDNAIFEATKAVLRTRAAGQEIELVFGDYKTFTPTEEYCGVIVQLPNATGSVEDYTYFLSTCHKVGVLVTVIEDLLAMALLKPVDADIVCGSAQRLGVPMAGGGLSVGYMSCRSEYKREMPGRIIGQSVDVNGHIAYRMALQMREQHIKREKATSNLCTAAALNAILVAFYAVYHGAEGIRKIAEDVHSKATYLNEALGAYNITQTNAMFFDTLCVKGSEGMKMISIDETTTTTDMENIFSSIGEEIANGINPQELLGLWTLPEESVREVDYLQHPVFEQYHTEAAMTRFIKRLERKDISLTFSMTPLGSCTMKLNPSAAMMALSNFPILFRMHPQIANQMLVLPDIKNSLCNLTGMEECCLQPTSGAAGEYAGLVTIRAYLWANNQRQRKHILIPASAHGTNPASCVQAGFIPVVIPCDEGGNTDLVQWRTQAEVLKETLAGCMITYPSTHGIFETGVKEMCEVIHANGGQVYLDGANMNALVGYVTPASIGADVCHLNLHKTFATPHGGGGPGAGAICCKKHLIPFLPSEDKNRVSSNLNGNLAMTLVANAYIRMMGSEGLKEATATAILNANYLAERLKEAYPIVYRGANGRVGHELILDCRQFKEYGITDTDIAKRLMDYGFHAPTLSFPVHGTLMVEPTESENKAELDRFIDAMLSIRAEIQEVIDGKVDSKDNVLLNAPHAEYEVVSENWTHPYSRQKAFYPLPFVAENKFWIPVARVDNGAGDRNLICKL